MLRFLRYLLVIFLFNIIFLGHIFAEGQISLPKLENILEPNIVQLLKKQGHVFQYGHAGLDYIKGFRDAQLRNDYEEIYYETATNYSVQILYFVPQEELKTLRNKDVYNAIRNISSLNNSYVVRDDRRDPFMTHVQEFATQDFKQKTQAEKLTTEDIPIFTETYMRAKDTRFGTIHYNIAYRHNMGRFMVIMKNIDSISYLFYKIADPNEFTTVMTVQNVQGGLLYVLQTFTSVKNLKTVEKKIDLRTFFSRRLEAIKGWFFREAYGMQVKQGIFPESIKLDD